MPASARKKAACQFELQAKRMVSMYACVLQMITVLLQRQPEGAQNQMKGFEIARATGLSS